MIMRPPTVLPLVHQVIVTESSHSSFKINYYHTFHKSQVPLCICAFTYDTLACLTPTSVGGLCSKTKLAHNSVNQRSTITS
jgi:hypothetical protein